MKTITWIALQPSVLRPRFGSKALEPVDRPTLERGNARQRGLPSLNAAITNLPMLATLVTDRTPSTPRMYSRSEEHTSELQSLMRISYAVFCLKKYNRQTRTRHKSELRRWDRA